MIYPYNGILFNNKLRIKYNTCYNMSLEDAKWKKRHKRPHILLFYLFEIYRKGAYVETERKLVVA